MAAALHALADAPDGTEARDIARELLAAAPSPATTLPTSEVLTERELDVLRLLAGDLTGPQLAAHLFVSINTLRTHTRRIFTKLDVTTRRAAVTRARELGLL